MLLSGALLWSPLLYGEQSPPTISLETSAASIEAYDVVTVTVTIDAAEGQVADLQGIREQLLQPRGEQQPAFKLLDEQINAPVGSGDGRYQQTLTYTLDPWREGRHPLSVSPVRFSGTSDEEVWGDLIYITVQRVDGSTSDTPLEPELLPFRLRPEISIDPQTKLELEARDRERHPQHTLEVFEHRTLQWRPLLIFASAAALLFLLRRWLKHLLQRLATSEEAPVSPREEALRELRRLREAELPEQSLFEPFYVKVTEIVRLFIEREHHLKAPEHTTEEFLQEVRGESRFNKDVQQLLGEFLSYADLVKFARFHPSADDCNSALGIAEQFVKSSTP